MKKNPKDNKTPYALRNVAYSKQSHQPNRKIPVTHMHGFPATELPKKQDFRRLKNQTEKKKAFAKKKATVGALPRWSKSLPFVW
jgi:hypothetical protein